MFSSAAPEVNVPKTPKEVFKEQITCPLSLAIFLEPVTLVVQRIVKDGAEERVEEELGSTVEKSYYERWVAEFNQGKRTDPRNRLAVVKLMPNRDKKALVEEFLKLYPEEKGELYRPNEHMLGQAQIQLPQEHKDIAPANPDPVAPHSKASSSSTSNSNSSNGHQPVFFQMPQTHNLPTEANMPRALGFLPGAVPPVVNSRTLYKGLLIGSNAADKSIFLQAVSGNNRYRIGTDFQLINVNATRHQLWDTGGQEHFATAFQTQLQEAHYILFFGDSFENINLRVNQARQASPDMEFCALNYHYNDGDLIPSLSDFKQNNLTTTMTAKATELPAFFQVCAARLDELIRHLRPLNQAQVPQLQPVPAVAPAAPADHKDEGRPQNNMCRIM